MANLTLSIDEDALKQARIYAIQHDTSVNALVRDYLKSLVEKPESPRSVADEIEALAQKVCAEQSIQPGWKWNREAIYDDRPDGPTRNELDQGAAR